MGKVQTDTSTVDAADLYQLAAYLSRFASNGTASGALVYPRGPEQEAISKAEAHSPWRSPAGNDVRFIRLAVDPAGAIRRLAEEPFAVAES